MSFVAPLALIIASLGTILVIIVRRFPQLSLLDVDNMPQVKEGKKKLEFLRRRVAERAKETQAARLEQWKPMVARWKALQWRFRRYVGNIERILARERERVIRRMSKGEAAMHAEDLRGTLQEGAFAFEQGDFEEAENKYLAVIRLDPKNKDAYLGLGDVYRKQEQTEEAKETYKFLAQLDPQSDVVRVKLAELAEEAGNMEEAIRYYEQAVLLNDNLAPRFAKLAELLSDVAAYPAAYEAIRQGADLEPQNPKYLDMLVEISILSGRKDAAEAAYDALRKVNPDNEKLAAFKDRIEKMG